MDSLSTTSVTTPRGPINRTGMGEYIPPPGGKQLTSLASGRQPGPADYLPKTGFVKTSAPKYSVQGRYVTLSSNAPPVGPADNDASGDLVWKNKRIGLKSKGETRPYDIRRKAHITDSIGPGRYNVETHRVGTEGPKHSVASRHKDGVHPGPPNGLIQPVDTLGVKTPGSSYLPASQRGPEVHIGLARTEDEPDGPGPAEYNTRSTEKQGPSFSLAPRPPFKAQEGIDSSPGPMYDVGTTIGKGPGATVKSRHNPRNLEFGPGPDEYMVTDTIGNGPRAVMTYKPFEMEDRPHPGPTKYTIKDTNSKKAPKHVFGQKTKPSFPDILHYPDTTQIEAQPAPCDYNDAKQGTVSGNDGPKYSMGRPSKPLRNHNPGPNAYSVKDTGKKKLPSFSMGRRTEQVDATKTGPGPAAYFPKIPQDSKQKQGFSLTQRPKDKTMHNTPGSNTYNVSQYLTNKGSASGPKYTMKSRASPFVYSGFHNVNMIKG